MKMLFPIALLLLITGCATSKRMYMPDGKVGYNITCSGSALNWGLCYEKAGKICGKKGYTIIEKSGDKGAIVSGNQYGLYGGSIINRNMLIVCGQEK